MTTTKDGRRRGGSPRDWWITAGDLRKGGGVSVQTERLAESGWNGIRLETDSSEKMEKEDESSGHVMMERIARA